MATAREVNERRERHRAIAALLNAQASVWFRHQRHPLGGWDGDAPSPGPTLLKCVFGEYYATDIYQVELTQRPELFTDAEAAHIAEFVDVDWLAIPNSRVTDKGLRCIASMTSLGRLDIEGCPVTANAVAELHKSLPNTDIYSDYGWPRKRDDYGNPLPSNKK